VQKLRFVGPEPQAVFDLGARFVQFTLPICAPCLLQRFTCCPRHAIFLMFRPDQSGRGGPV
jgi:hypothetical protein